MAEELLPRTVCIELGISRGTLYRWCDAGILHPQKLGPLQWRVFERSDVERVKSRLKKTRRVGGSLLTD